jgi:hypothetical protein
VYTTIRSFYFATSTHSKPRTTVPHQQRVGRPSITPLAFVVPLLRSALRRIVALPYRRTGLLWYCYSASPASLGSE